MTGSPVQKIVASDPGAGSPVSNVAAEVTVMLPICAEAREESDRKSIPDTRDILT